jgi:hypothetical protein
MNTQQSCRLVTAGILACAVAGVAPRTASAQAVIDSITGDHHKLPVTAVGCLQSEKDYRRQHHSGRGGFLRTGAGDGNEFILVNATIGLQSMQVAPASEEEVNNCAASQDNGQAFELTGHGERDLAPYVGRRVVVNGMLKHAKHDPETVGTAGEFVPRPTGGGVDLTGAELAIREINVDGFALAPIAAPVREEAPIAPAPEPPALAPEPAPAPAPEPQAAPPAPAAPELPKTASPLPAIGLIGLFSLAGAFGLRLLRPRTRPF